MRKLTLLLIAFAFPLQQPQSPQQVAQSLLDADRAYAKAASNTDMVGALSAMFADGVLSPAPPTGLLVGKAAVINAIKEQPDVATSRVTWTPIRVGVSQDAQHGFSFGYLTMIKADGTRVPQKYMAYWVRENFAWRVMAYKRGRAPSAPTDTTVMNAALPFFLVARNTDTLALNELRHGLMKSEATFSDQAQRDGLGNAFEIFGRNESVNMGGAALPHFVVGSKAIAQLVSDGDMKASSLHWSADTALIASSGDLGITFGRIYPNGDKAPTTAGTPFFTIWIRGNAQGPWRYIAE